MVRYPGNPLTLALSRAGERGPRLAVAIDYSKISGRRVTTLFRLEKKHADEMIAHAIQDAPNECCGIVAGKEGKVSQVFRAKNADLSPYRYTIDTTDLLRIDEEISDKGWEWVGIYHSHTFVEAYPSATDINLAFLPQALYFIVSLRDLSHPQLRAFHISREEGTATEEPLQIVA